jgi:predicted CXXCH cytochrome family protein
MVALAPSAHPVRAGVTDTVHNLAASGPGTVRATSVDAVCVFCHTPHNASPQRALWNRDLPGETYQIYDSTTLLGAPGQPTGASRLCLSCHDGTLALSSLRVPPPSGAGSLGPLQGPAVLGTDLSDDHPISFLYSTALALRRGELVEPPALPPDVPLDAENQLQCTTCHDPHEDPFRQFLRVDDRGGALCTRCHRMREWSASTHATSPASWSGTGTDPWPRSPYTTVADNACESCHRPHAAGHGERILTQSREPEVCLVCHDGSVARHDLRSVFTVRPSTHPVDLGDFTHDPAENPLSMARHVACMDCHNPHQASSVPASAPALSGRLRGVSGLTLSGAFVREASFEYEICLKCHGLVPQATPSFIRQDNLRNVRQEIEPSNPSYHPVAAVGANPNVEGLEPGYSATSRIYCTDCHNNDEAANGATRPRGPHGSQFAPILERMFLTDDGTPESPQAYALCYKCHTRSGIIQDRAGRFPHERHVVENRAPCAVCHDAHGSRRNRGLINFMLVDRTGLQVVRADRLGRLEFLSTQPGRGQCYLNCHGVEHDGFDY